MVGVLIVEDEEIVAWGIQEILESIGHHVLATVDTGEAAIQIVETVKPNLAVIDIRLQGEMDGIAVAETIWTLYQVPFIYLTACADDLTLQRAITTTPFGYLVKPFDLKTLQTTIEVALRRYRLENNLLTRQEWLYLTLSSIPDATIAVNREGYITFINSAAENLTGWQHQEALGKDATQVLRLVDPTTRAVIENPLLQAIQKKTIVKLPAGSFLLSKDHQERPIADSAAPICNQQGEVIGGVLVFQDATEQQREQLLRHVVQQIHRSLVLDEVLATVTTEIQQLLQAKRTLILRLNLDGSGEVIHEAVLPHLPATVGATLSRVFSPELLRSDFQGYFPRLVTGATEPPLSFSEIDEQLGTDPKLVAAIVKDKEAVSISLWGLLVCVANNGIWQPAEAGLLQQIGDELTIALQRAELYQQLRQDVIQHQQTEVLLRQALEQQQRTIRQDQLVTTIAQTIRQFLDLDYILNTTVEEVRAFLQVDRVVINRFNSDWSGTILAEATVDPALSILGRTIRDPCFNKRLVDAYCQGRTHTVGDIQSANLNPCYVQQLVHLRVQAVLVVPILVRHELWGLLVVHQCRNTRQWQQSITYLLQQLSAQLAIGIYQAELYQQIQYQAQREQILNQIVQAMRRTLELDTLLTTASTEIAHLLRVDQVNILKYIPEQPIWRTIATFHRFSDLPSALELEIPDSGNPISERLKRLEIARIDNMRLTQDEMNWALGKQTSGAWLLAPLQINTMIWGSLSLWRRQIQSWQEWEVDLVQAVADQLAIAIQQSELYQQLQSANQQLQNLVTVDGLTQISNRRRFDEYFLQEWQRLARDPAPLSLIFCDVDYFKNFNDTYGHLAGDDCLIQVAQAIRRAIHRPGDLVARYGGEEFVVVLPITDINGAIQVVQAIQAEVQRLDIPHAASAVSRQVTLSFGIASTNPVATTSAQELIDRADRALYQAKAEGRNRYYVNLG